MSSPPSTANPQLPFDVLGSIFNHYASEETIHHPLETLLLVCHFWKRAALGHRTLWNDLRIYLGHSPSSNIWRKRLPLRLARAGPAVPLFISLFNVLDIQDRFDVPECVEDDLLYSDCYCTRKLPKTLVAYKNQCPCYQDARECAEFALKCLTGKNGDLCARWKEFHVDLGYGNGYDASKCLAIALSYPTPSLTSLEMSNFVLYELEDQNLTPLTEMPRLQKLIVKSCFLLQVPNFQALLEVHLIGTELLDLGTCSNLRSASQLQVLRLWDISADGVILPEELPNLCSIEIIGDNFPITLQRCLIPDLSSVALEFENANPISDILACPRIDLGKLQKLSLQWTAFGVDRTVEACEDMIKSLHGLVTRAPNLSYVAGDHHIVSLFLRILWDSWSQHGTDGILRSKRFLLHFIEDADFSERTGRFEATFTGNYCPETLVMLAKKWGLLSPDLPIAEFLNLLPDLKGPIEAQWKEKANLIPLHFPSHE